MKRKPSNGAMLRKLRARVGKPLSARELEVAALLAKGLSNKLIADAINISGHTAKFHIDNIMKKYGAQTRTGAAVMFAMSKIELAPHVCTSCGASVSPPA